MEIDPNTWGKLRNSILAENLVSLRLIDENCWKAVVFDDNAFDFDHLERALRMSDVAEYYCVPVNDLELPLAEARILKMTVGARGWRQFFEFDANGFSANLEDCIFFSSPLKFVILRTGFVEHTIYVGTSDFLALATRFELEDERVVAVGKNWARGSVLNYYNPKRLDLGST